MRPGLSSLKWLHFSVPPGPASFSLGKESQGVAPPPQTCSLTHPGLGGASPTALPLLHLRRGLASPCSPGTGAGAGLPGLKLPTSLPVPSCWKPSHSPREVAGFLPSTSSFPAASCAPQGCGSQAGWDLGPERGFASLPCPLHLAWPHCPAVLCLPTSCGSRKTPALCFWSGEVSAAWRVREMPYLVASCSVATWVRCASREGTSLRYC